MLRGTLKTVGSWVLHGTGGDRLVGAARGVEQEPLVLCYHRVVHDLKRHGWSAPAMLVTKRTLAAQLEWVGRRYRFVTLDELADSIAAGERPQRPLAAVTFDDGYADVYRNGLPVLSRMGVPATAFVVTDLIGTDGIQLHDRLHALLRQANRRFGATGVVSLLDRHRLEHPPWRGAPRGVGGWAGGGGAGEASWPHDRKWSRAQMTRLGERLLATQPRIVLDRLATDLERYVAVPRELADTLHALDWDMLRRLQKAGVVIGSHTRSHRVLPNESPDDVWNEIAGSKRTLEEKLQTEVRHFSYPNGHFTTPTVRAVRAAGYRYAYSTCFHRDRELPTFTISRRTFWERSLGGVGRDVSAAVASCLVRGVFDRRGACPHDHGTAAAEPAGSRINPPDPHPPRGRNGSPVGEPARP
jgi:peptidoglycan/xylan/chitin deacetylase (PgdA/CDA1 family)